MPVSVIASFIAAALTHVYLQMCRDEQNTCTHLMEYYLAIKREELLIYVTI